MTSPPPPPSDEGLEAFLPPPFPAPDGEPLFPPPPDDTATAAVPSSEPPKTGAMYRHTLANEETTVLTPVTAATNILDRIPLSERKRWILIAGGAAGLVLLLLGFAIYLLVINNQWQTRSEALTVEAYDLGQRLTDAREQIVEKQAQIDLLGEQLNTARNKVIELADEMAQAGDDATYIQYRLALHQELSALGGSVSLALNHCVNEHEKLVGYLKDPGAWDAASLAAYESDVDLLCDAAQNANATLQKALTE